MHKTLSQTHLARTKLRRVLLLYDDTFPENGGVPTLTIWYNLRRTYLKYGFGWRIVAI